MLAHVLEVSNENWNSHYVFSFVTVFVMSSSKLKRGTTPLQLVLQESYFSFQSFILSCFIFFSTIPCITYTYVTMCYLKGQSFAIETGYKSIWLQCCIFPVLSDLFLANLLSFFFMQVLEFCMQRLATEVVTSYYNASFFIWWISGLPKVFYLSYVANNVFSCWLSGFICLLVKIFTCSWRVSLLHIELYSILSLLHINFIIAAWWFISFSISLVCFVTQTHYSS